MENVGMMFGLAVAIIAVGITISTIVQNWLNYREKKLEVDAAARVEIAALQTTRDGALEQRIRVLERIVTEKGIDVADEIERLRDARVG
jgi:hypothetical protein